MASWFSTLTKDPYGSLNPEQIQVNKALGSSLLSNINDPASNYEYQGNLTAPIGAGTQDVIANNARVNAIAGNTYSDLGNYNDPNFNNQFNSEIQDPSIDNFRRNIEPLLGEELPSFGTARANVISRSLGDLQNNLLQQRFAARESAKNRALTALTDSSNYFNTSAGIQDIPRAIQQAGIDKQYANFIQANQAKQNSVNQALNFLGISTGTTTQEPTTFGNILNTAKSAAQIYSSLSGGGSSGSSSAGGGFSNTTPMGYDPATAANTSGLTFAAA